jgi:tRNA pseudouridine38-40 synthase
MLYRYAIELAYNGTDFFGWQIQVNQISIQEEIETQINKLIGDEVCKLVGCGRTDSGVHASYYVAHFDIQQVLDTEKLGYKLNKMLSKSIVVFSIQLVTEEFHARFSATKRTYNYYISAEKHPFNPNYWLLLQPIDLEKMNLAAQKLIGTKDFTSFAKLHTDAKTNICTVSLAHWKQKDAFLVFEISADRFLRNMVRSVVSTLVDVGLDKISLEDFENIIAGMDRSLASASAPAKGLFLTDVHYPSSIFTRLK